MATAPRDEDATPTEGFTGGPPPRLGRPPTPDTPAFPGLQVLEEVAPGSGGMGEVYRARELSLDRIVAVKTVKHHLRTPEGRALFAREAQAAAALDHPGIVRIHSFNAEHEPPYCVMQFVEGRPLDRACSGRSFPEVAALMEQVVEALSCAHEHGVVHRDIKPANILVDFEGRAHITDFGLAARLGAGAPAPSSSSTAGTPLLIPPEVYSGRGADSPAVDIYALGVTLYRLLTGRYPFEGEDRDAVKHAVLEAEPPFPHDLNSDVPEALQRICLKAMEPNPRERYGSARQMGVDLKRFREGKPVSARPRRYQERLDGKLRNYLSEAQTWGDQNLVTTAQLDSLSRPARRLLEAETPWYGPVGRFSWEMLLLRVGAWVLMISCLLWPVFYWYDMGRVAHLLSVGAPVLLVNLLGWGFLARRDRTNALIFLATGTLLVPLFTSVLLIEYGWLEMWQHVGGGHPPMELLEGLPEEVQRRMDDEKWALYTVSYGVQDSVIVEGGAPLQGPSAQAPLFVPSNMQLLVSWGVALLYALLLLVMTRMRVFAIWSCIAAYLCFTAVLLRMGLLIWLDREMVAFSCLLYVIFTLLFRSMGLVLDSPARRSIAAAIYLFFPLPFAFFLTLLAYHGAVEWLGAASYFDEEMINLWWMANGGIYFMLGLWAARATASHVRYWGEMLMLLVPLSLLLPSNLLFHKGVALFPLGQGEEGFTLYQGVHLLFIVGLILLGTRMRRSALTIPALAALVVYLFRITNTHFPDTPAWPLVLVVLGAGAMAVGSLAALRRRRMR